MSLFNELQGMGAKANAEIAALTGLTEQELKEYAEIWREKHELAREQAIKELEYLREETDNEIAALYTDLNAIIERNSLPTGAAMIQGLIQGVLSETSSLYDTLTQIAEGAANRVRETLGIHSPSRVFAAMGENIIISFADSVKRAKNTVDTALYEVFGELEEGIETDLKLNLTGIETNLNAAAPQPGVAPNLAAFAAPAAAVPYAEPSKSAFVINLQNHFHGLTVRDDTDIETIAERVKESLARDIRLENIIQGV